MEKETKCCGGHCNSENQVQVEDYQTINLNPNGRETYIDYARVRDVKKPERGTSEASGIDLFIPKFTESFLEDLKKKNGCISEIKPGNFEYVIDMANKRILLAPHAKLMIPSGIKFRGTKYLSLDAGNKSGIGTKKGLDRLAEICDSDYQGEVHISISNTTPFIIEVCEDEKIIQFIQRHIALDIPREVSHEDLFLDVISERGEGGFGSTNK